MRWARHMTCMVRREMSEGIEWEWRFSSTLSVIWAVDANMQPGMLRGLGGKEELDKTAKENNIKISVITESKKTLHGAKRD